VQRTVVFKLKLTAAQTQSLAVYLCASRELDKAALEQRIGDRAHTGSSPGAR
jgi:hypothetical protein